MRGNKMIHTALNLYWEKRLGVSTRAGSGPVVPAGDGIAYSTLSFHQISTVLKNLRLSPVDTFYDIGCGKGRVVCCAARLPLRRVIGVEIDQSLADVARQNALRLAGRQAAVEILCASATEIEYAGTAYYLFHPFGETTLRGFLGSVERSVRLTGRNVRIAYANPVHEKVLDEFPWLKQYDRWDYRGRFLLEHIVTFHESRL